MKDPGEFMMLVDTSSKVHFVDPWAIDMVSEESDRVCHVFIEGNKLPNIKASAQDCIKKILQARGI